MENVRKAGQRGLSGFGRQITFRLTSRWWTARFFAPLALFAVLAAPLAAPAQAATPQRAASAAAAADPLDDCWFIYSYVSGLFVSARHNVSGSPLQASAAQPGTWERFCIWPWGYDELGFQLYAIRAESVYKFVSARLNVTNSPLRASADSISTWELFRFRYNSSDGSYSLVAHNQKFVSARLNSTGAPLWASASIPSTWEKFYLTH
ncbi:hypothetical protein GA0070607_4117 [Micromonospora coriariae]|uniref:Ricin B lectin domain-containing protein n=1 Tax=Micromonospora coriariae TaxID=285665 RepID=A0A1C4WT43_9ACTN|nr:hypothetical protein [Micromonospora coriariae]SCE99417.1 hypothetical protein GA0070607_4117 [Micromonospora coriariae]